MASERDEIRSGLNNGTSGHDNGIVVVEGCSKVADGA